MNGCSQFYVANADKGDFDFKGKCNFIVIVCAQPFFIV